MPIQQQRNILSEAKEYDILLLNRYKNEIFNFFGTALFIAVLPIGIFYLASEKERYCENAKKISSFEFYTGTDDSYFFLT